MKQSTKNGQLSRKTSKKKPDPLFPPQLQSSFQVDRVMRFKASGALNAVSIASANLLNTLIVALTATTSARLPVSVRLRKVRAWAPPDSAGAAVTLTIEDVAAGIGISNPSRRIEDVTMGQSRPAHVTLKPRADSLSSNWLDLNAGAQFVLTGPSGTVVDVHLSFILQDGETPVSAGALSGATAGQMYMRALDASGSGLLVPVGFPAI